MKKIIVLFMLVFILTGCVKVDQHVDTNVDTNKGDSSNVDSSKGTGDTSNESTSKSQTKNPEEISINDLAYSKKNEITMGDKSEVINISKWDTKKTDQKGSYHKNGIMATIEANLPSYHQENCILSYQLNKKYSALTGKVAFDGVDALATLSVQIIVDEKMVYPSAYGSNSINILLKGADTLVINFYLNSFQISSPVKVGTGIVDAYLKQE